MDSDKPVRAELEKIVHQEFSESALVSVHLRDGVPYNEIVVAARELEADLIISSVTRHVPCSLCGVPGEYPTMKPLHALLTTIPFD